MLNFQKYFNRYFSYSIADFHSLNSTLGNGVTFEQLGNFVNFMQDKWSVLTIHDVVWNHAARNSSWLRVKSLTS